MLRKSLLRRYRESYTDIAIIRYYIENSVDGYKNKSLSTGSLFSYGRHRDAIIWIDARVANSIVTGTLKIVFVISFRTSMNCTNLDKLKQSPILL